MIHNLVGTGGGGGGGTILPIKIPTADVTSFVYDGTLKELSLNNYTTSAIVSTNTSATQPGNYIATFNLIDISSCVWQDGTTSEKTIAWTMSKGQSSLLADKNSITLNTNNLIDTINLTIVGDANVSVTSSDLNVATATVENGTVTISNVNQTSGIATITLSMAENSHYYASNIIEIEVTCEFTFIYGVEWDGTSTTLWTRTDAAAEFTDPIPAVNNGDGSSPFDNIMPWSGMQRVQFSSCGTMVSIPKFWYKWTRTGKKMKLQIANGQVDGFLVSPAHADRGDGNGQRDYVYVGAYHCATSTYKSTTDKYPQVNITRANFRTAIHNLGTNVWQWDYAMYWTICMLYLVQFADWNSQAKIGYGCGNNSFTENMGSTDSMTYHTGTNASNRTTYGHTRYRYIEGLWDNVFDWCDGIYFSGSNIYCIKNPSSFSDSSGGTLVGTRATSSKYISAWTNPIASGFEYALYPNAVNGSATTYVTDYCYYGSSGVVLRVGGNYNQDKYRGLFCLSGNSSASSYDINFGSRPMLLP